MKRIRAVSFDVDGTLYRRSLRLALRAAFIRGGLRTIRLVKEARECARLEAFTSPEALRDRVCKELSEVAAVDDQTARAMIERMRGEIVPTVLRGAARSDASGAIRVLRNAGVRVAAFSDHDCSAKLEVLGLDRGLFDVVVSAEDWGAYKPHAAGFARLQKELDVPAEAILHVGDREDTDVAGARAAGMAAALIGGKAAPPGVMHLRNLAELALRFASLRRH